MVGLRRVLRRRNGSLRNKKMSFRRPLAAATVHCRGPPLRQLRGVRGSEGMRAGLVAGCAVPALSGI